LYLVGCVHNYIMKHGFVNKNIFSPFFWRFRIVAKSAYSFYRVCRSVRLFVFPHMPVLLPPDQFSWNLLLETFTKICLGWCNYRALDINISVGFTFYNGMYVAQEHRKYNVTFPCRCCQYYIVDSDFCTSIIQREGIVALPRKHFKYVYILDNDVCSSTVHRNYIATLPRQESLHEHATMLLYTYIVLFIYVNCVSRGIIT
jgi:hypothetical protein